MKAVTAAPSVMGLVMGGALLASVWLLVSGCAAEPRAHVRAGIPAESVVIASPPGTMRPPFRFTGDDESLLDLVQRGAWNWAVDAANPKTYMVPDRDSRDYISTAGVGFQLAAFPVAVERGWMPRAEAERRVRTILTTLAEVKTTRKFGMYQHFVDGDTGELPKGAYEDVVSTIDSALLFAGCIVASSYFGGETARLADPLIEAADWSAFVDKGAGVAPRHYERGFVSLGWKPDDIRNDPVGSGTFLPYYWHDSGCEHRLISFLAAAAPSGMGADPAMYYRLRRQIGTDPAPGVGQVVYFPWSGALFTNQFSHVFINYASMGPDNPAAFGVPARASVDWWENARRMTNLHRARAVAWKQAHPHSPFGENAWGLTASDYPGGYQVAGVFPKLDEQAMAGSRFLYDFSWYQPPDDFGTRSKEGGTGTIAPYAAGMSVMFEPAASIAALRHYKQVAATTPAMERLWKDPTTGGHGFADAYNPSRKWVGTDHLAIDQLPMLLAIENARSGLVWRLFHAHPLVKRGMERLNLRLD